MQAVHLWKETIIALVDGLKTAQLQACRDVLMWSNTNPVNIFGMKSDHEGMKSDHEVQVHFICCVLWSSLKRCQK